MSVCSYWIHTVFICFYIIFIYFLFYFLYFSYFLCSYPVPLWLQNTINEYIHRHWHWCHFSTRTERCRPASAWSWPQVTYHGSPTRFTLAAGQAPHHIQNCITDASGSSPAVSNVSVRPCRVQLRRHSAATSFYYHQSCRRSTNQDSVRTADLRCLWSRHLERSSPSYPHHRLLPCFPAFAKNTPISYCF